MLVGGGVGAVVGGGVPVGALVGGGVGDVVGGGVASVGAAVGGGVGDVVGGGVGDVVGALVGGGVGEVVGAVVGAGVVVSLDPLIPNPHRNDSLIMRYLYSVLPALSYL